MQAIKASETIAFTTNIPFNRPVTAIQPQILTAPLVFTINNGGARAGYRAILRLVGNGSAIPNLSLFKKSNTSRNYDVTNGMVNVIMFLFDGTDYWYAIYQQGGGVADVKVLKYTGTGGEKEFTNPLLIDKSIIWIDREDSSYDAITVGVPGARQMLHNTANGKLSWNIALEPGESIKLLYK